MNETSQPSSTLQYGTRYTLTSTDLKRRGWTNKMIIKLLGEGEKAPNPYGDMPLRLYRLADAIEHEMQREFTIIYRRTSFNEKFPEKPKAKIETALTSEELQVIINGKFELPFEKYDDLKQFSHNHIDLVAMQSNRRPKKTIENVLLGMHEAMPEFNSLLNHHSEPGQRRALHIIVSLAALQYPVLDIPCLNLAVDKLCVQQLLPADSIPGQAGRKALLLAAQQGRPIDKASRVITREEGYAMYYGCQIAGTGHPELHRTPGWISKAKLRSIERNTEEIMSLLNEPIRTVTAEGQITLLYHQSDIDRVRESPEYKQLLKYSN